MKDISPAVSARPLSSPALFLLRPFAPARTGVAAPSFSPATATATACGGFRRQLRRGFPVELTLAVALGTMLSLAPGLLPRAAAAQALLTSVLVAALLGFARLSSSFRSCRRRDTPSRRLPHGGIVSVSPSGALSTHRPSAPSTAPDRPPTNTLGGRPADQPSARPGDRTWRAPADRSAGVLTERRTGAFPRVRNRAVADCMAGVSALRYLVLTVAVLGVVVAVAQAVSWQNTLRDAMGVAQTGAGYWSFWAAGSLVLTVVLVAAGSGAGRLLRRIGWSRMVVTAVVATLPVAFFAVPGAAAASGGGADSGLVRPVAMTRSGSAESLVSWASLGREGQRFVTNGPVGAVRVYVGLRSAPDPASRAELAVRELDRAGGFDRSHLVVAVPTGSGWVDARALRGFGTRFGADFAVAALQYSHLPSWATFVLGRDSAAASARALFTAIEEHAATLPDPPRLYLYGQSLGALGGSAVFAGAAEQNRRACSVLWAGMPGGGGREPGARTVVLANTSDPVVHWSPDLLWRPPDLTGGRRDAPIPGWLPVVSFVQTTVDLLGALAAPPGHGHRYDVDQGTALPGCG